MFDPRDQANYNSPRPGQEPFLVAGRAPDRDTPTPTHNTHVGGMLASGTQSPNPTPPLNGLQEPPRNDQGGANHMQGYHHMRPPFLVQSDMPHPPQVQGIPGQPNLPGEIQSQPRFQPVNMEHGHDKRLVDHNGQHNGSSSMSPFPPQVYGGPPHMDPHFAPQMNPVSQIPQFITRPPFQGARGVGSPVPLPMGSPFPRFKDEASRKLARKQKKARRRLEKKLFDSRDKSNRLFSELCEATRVLRRINGENNTLLDLLAQTGQSVAPPAPLTALRPEERDLFRLQASYDD